MAKSQIFVPFSVLYLDYELLLRSLRSNNKQINKALHDECLPIVCAVDKKQKILLNVDSRSSDEVTTKINEVPHGDYLEELTKLLAEKLNSILETTTAGEEGLYTHVVFANKSVLRLDLFVYHHRFKRTENLNGKKKLRIRKYPDTCGRGLIEHRGPSGK